MLGIAPDFTMDVDERVYPRADLLRVCYRFTDRCWLWLSAKDGAIVTISVVTKDRQADGLAVRGEFANALIDQLLRRQIADETGSLRETLVAAAIAGAAPRRDSRA